MSQWNVFAYGNSEFTPFKVNCFIKKRKNIYTYNKR